MKWRFGFKKNGSTKQHDGFILFSGRQIKTEIFRNGGIQG